MTSATIVRRHVDTSMTPAVYTVRDRSVETADTVTVVLTPDGAPLPRFQPGQFAMMYAFGVGEVPISLSGTTDAGHPVHTLRAVGAVTNALHGLRIGQRLGLRGPFGTGWQMPAAAGTDLVIVAGGIGLAPLRPVIYAIIADRNRYGAATVLIGARTPGELLYPTEYDRWRKAGIVVAPTVDRADAAWPGSVGLVTTLFTRLTVRPAVTAAYLCGPEVMMRFAGRGLADLGVSPDRIQVSLERNMRCGVGHCGHCQLGPWLLCRDGPVVPYDRAAPLMSIKEL